MSLKRLINKGFGLRASGFGGSALALFVVGAGLVGCSPSPNPESRIPNPVRGYVRLDALTAVHPLQREVRRLREMEETLRRIPGPPPALPPALARLPALPISSNGGGNDLASAQERRDRERALLRAETERQLAEYAAGRRARTARLLEQLRAELLGQLAARDAAAAQTSQRKIEGETYDAILGLTPRKLETYSLLALTEGQLNRGMEFFAPPLGADQSFIAPAPSPEESALGNRAELEGIGGITLEADDTFRGRLRRERLARAQPPPPAPAAPPTPPTPYPTMPERLETYRQQDLAELRRLDAEIRRIKRAGRVEISDAEREARLKRLRDIEDRLDAYRDDMEIALILREQRRILNAVLDAEDAAARESLRAAQGGNADRGFDFSLLGAGTIAPPTFSTARAINRLTAQRRELESLIRVGVADSVRDIARKRNVDVTLINNGAELSAKRIVPTSGQDMTQEFKNWLATEIGTADPAPNVGKGGRL